ncbi:MAG: DUF929 domain-containing protein [Thermoplasmata archaeon]|nr:DUF929 domain-containing protein [Thermoplasmata archaeon]
MVDWDQVEKLRAKGWEWDRIAEDPKVEFKADAGSGDPGRALRALFYQRRSRQSKRSKPGAEGSSSTTDEKDLLEPIERRKSIVGIGYLLLPLFGVWFLIALAYPTPVAIYIAAIPWVLAGVIIAVLVLGFGLLQSSKKWSSVARNSLAIGAVLGIVIAGGLGLAAVAAGCPTLSSSTVGEPSGWSKAANPTWKIDGNSVFLFYGSIACPYCSASSWAVLAALMQMGQVSSSTLTFGSSNPGDVYPNTPEVYVYSIALSSKYISLDAREGTDPTSITTPAVSCVEQAYATQYDTGGSIPFLVINGQYFHVGTLVNPQSLAGLSPQTVYDQVTSQSGAAWTAIAPSAYLLEAIMVKVNDNQPASVASNPNVSPLLQQLT